MAVTVVSSPSWAAAPNRAFSIPAKPLASALVDFAVQARVSVGDGGACKGRSKPVSGELSIPDALAKLLEGTGCTYRRIDDGAFRIVRAPPPPVQPRLASAPAPPKPQAAASPEPAPGFSEVVVTGTRRELAEGRVSASVSLVPAERLRITGGRDERDAARQVAGVAMTNLGMGRDKIMIRGLSDGAFTGRTQSAVGTYLDQTPITYNAPDPDLYLADVDRVEVLKGPQGALYGGGSLAGVFRIVTRQPVLGDASLLVRVGRSYTQDGSPGRLAEGTFNLPLGAKAALRLVGYTELRGGYFDDPTHSNPDKTRRDGGRAALAYQIAPGWRLNASAAVQDIETADAHYATMTPDNRRWQRWRANRIAESHKNRFSEGSITLEGVGDWGKLSSTTTFVHHAFASRYDASNAVSIEDDAEALGIYDDPSRTELLVQDTSYLSPAGRKIQWLAGAFFLQSREETTPQLFALNSTTRERSPIYGDLRLDRRQELAAYGELSYNFARDWTLAIGGRGFRMSTRTRSDVTTVGRGVSRSFEGEHSYWGFSPKIALSWQRPSGALFYLMASQGYRAGGFNTGGFNPPNLLRQYSPDRLWNTEFGAKFDLFGGKLRVREALFYDIWSNIQTDAFNLDGLPFTYNVGRGRSLGFEAEMRYQATRHLTLQANALLTDTRLTRVFGPQPTYRESLPGAPRASFNTLAVWDQELGFGVLKLGAEFGYVGASHVTFDRVALPPSGDYFTGRVFLELRRGRWTLGGYFDNPTNSTADTFAYGNPFSFGQTRQATPLRPRTLRATLTTEF